MTTNQKNLTKVKNGIITTNSRIKTVKEVESPTKDQKVSLRVDIKNIMHAFGDSSHPLPESVIMMETILRLELNGFLYLCDAAARITKARTLGLQEAIYTMRNDKNRLLKLFKYFATKDQQLKLLRQNQVSNKPIPKRSYMAEIISILEGMDESGDMLLLIYRVKMGSVTESKRTEQALKADRVHLRSPNYIAYAKARSVSFSRKLGVLQQWMQTNLRSEHRQSPVFMEVMAFLTYELCAHMVDLTFIVRRERFGYSNPIVRLCDPRGSNPETCASAPAFQLQKKRKDDDCNNVSEILVQASEMEAKRLKKMPGIRDGTSLLPSEISEAYSRFQGAHCPTTVPSQSYKSRADRRNKFMIL